MSATAIVIATNEFGRMRKLSPFCFSLFSLRNVKTRSKSPSSTKRSVVVLCVLYIVMRCVRDGMSVYQCHGIGAREDVPCLFHDG